MNQVRPLVRNNLLAIYAKLYFQDSSELCIQIISFFCTADRNNLSLNSMKKRQRTKKFPMTAGSWTGPEGPTGKNCTLSSGVSLYISVLYMSN